ncbi:MAG: efflux RND transporter periplasmic adaptor subunit [Kiritimatiellales bacterium]|nr:efflux RND transporter periplasmic adaptor subunit [Kiritimatiellales bacterium]
MSSKGIGVVVAAVVVSLLAGWFGRGLLGGGKGGMPPMMGPGQMPPAAVAAKVLKEQSLQPVSEYIAKVEPVQEVMVRTEVPGYVAQVHFTEGAMVKEGDLLFTIDQSQYRATVAVREADVTRAKAELVRAQKYLDRLKTADERSVSRNDLDTAESDLLRAEAALKQTEANLNLAQIDLDYTQIRAPIGGRIGAVQMTKGNYVTSASGELARIVQTDPIRVVLSLTDREYLTFKQQEQAGTTAVWNAQIRLPNGTVLPTIGKIDFADNAMNPETGTMAVRYLFDNRDGLLVPGGYAKALLSKPEVEMGIRIPQKAVLVDQQGEYVLTVDEAGLVSMARIAVGAQIDTDVIVLSGLKSGDRIIVDGIQKAHPGATVQATLLEE